MLLFAGISAQAEAQTDAAARGEQLAAQVFNRPANTGRVGDMHFRLVNARGAVRERMALMAHAQREEDVRVAIFFTEPAAIRDTAFLSHDRHGEADQNWLFLPATERVRRLPASERGDFFMGTDLSYGDIRDDFKFNLEDWVFEAGETSEAGTVLRGVARTPELAREMGYGAFEAIIDLNTLFPVRIQFADRDGDPLKVVEVQEQGVVGGAWTVLRFSVENLQRGHRTEIFFTDMRHVPDLSDTVFNPGRLALGVPRISMPDIAAAQAVP
jgi:hypothetical protein